MAQVHYVVDFHEDTWRVSLNEKRFGPYSTLDTAVAAASKAARQAEDQGYEAFVRIDTPDEAAAEDRNAA